MGISTTDCRRVVVIGLDGATFDRIKPWVENGDLPILAKLLKEGASAEMRSTLHPYTAQAWVTMATGTNAGKHRIFDFWERDYHTYGFRLMRAGYRSMPAIWSHLSAAGKRVVVINVPMTFPPEAVDGIMVAGRDTPGLSSEYTYPPSYKHRLSQHQIKPYVIVPEDWRFIKLGQPEKALRCLIDEIDIRFNAAHTALSEHDWDFCMFVVGATDGVSHYFWKYHDPEYPTYDSSAPQELKDAILTIYRRCDEQLGKFLQDIPKDTGVIVISDHGSGSEPSVAVHLNSWLEQRGLFQRTAQPSLPLHRRLLGQAAQFSKAWLRERISFQWLTRLRSAWPDAWRSQLDADTLFGDVVWAKTHAYSDERRGNIWINVRGRDPQGVIEPGPEYEALRDFIVSRLPVDLHDPQSGEPLIHRVWRREELFSGNELLRMPDLIVEAFLPDIFKRGGRNTPECRIASAREMITWHTSGGHRQNGILIAHGPGIRAGAQLDVRNLLDFAPSILYWMGLSVPDIMDNPPCTELFTPQWLSEHPLKVATTSTTFFPQVKDAGYSASEAKEIEERLKSLGYLD